MVVFYYCNDQELVSFLSTSRVAFVFLSLVMFSVLNKLLSGAILSKLF